MVLRNESPCYERDPHCKIFPEFLREGEKKSCLPLPPLTHTTTSGIDHLPLTEDTCDDFTWNWLHPNRCVAKHPTPLPCDWISSFCLNRTGGILTMSYCVISSSRLEFQRLIGGASPRTQAASQRSY